jgi:glyoxylase-like metal-dependent hydrolase (beta-lactamase superfamily II)
MDDQDEHGPATGESRESRESRAVPTIEALAVGQLAANCYVVVCPTSHDAALIDPGDAAPRILDRVRALGAHVTHVLHTHGHFDHISATEQVLAGLSGSVALGAHPADAFLYGDDYRDGIQELASQFGYPVVTPRAQPTLALADGARVAIGTLTLRVVHTPGHTPGGISLVCEPWCVFSGDTLFRRGIGRTDLPGGDEDALYASIETHLYPLDPELIVYPGHGAPTTIGEERRLNPFVRG